MFMQRCTPVLVVIAKKRSAVVAAAASGLGPVIGRVLREQLFL